MATRGGTGTMSWPVTLYVAALWILLSSVWLAIRPTCPAGSHRELAWQVVRDILPGILLAVLIGSIV